MVLREVDTAHVRLGREGIGLVLYSHFKLMACGCLPNFRFGKVRMRSIQMLAKWISKVRSIFMYRIVLSIALVLLISGCESMAPKSLDISTAGMSTEIRFPSGSPEFDKSKNKFFKESRKKRLFATNSYSGYLSNERYFDGTNKYIFWNGVYLISAGGNRYMDSYTKYTFNVACNDSDASHICKVTTENASRIEDGWLTTKHAPVLMEKRALELIAGSEFSENHVETTRYDQEIIFNELKLQGYNPWVNSRSQIEFTYRDKEYGTVFVVMGVEKSKSGYRVPVFIKMYASETTEGVYDLEKLSIKIKSIIKTVIS